MAIVAVIDDQAESTEFTPSAAEGFLRRGQNLSEELIEVRIELAPIARLQNLREADDWPGQESTSIMFRGYSSARVSEHLSVIMRSSGKEFPA